MRFQSLSSILRSATKVALLVSVTLLLAIAYILLSRQTDSAQQQPSTPDCLTEQPPMQDDADSSPTVLSAPLPNGSCSMYGELRQVNFLHASLRHRLCRGAAAYQVRSSAFPLCELPDQLPDLLLRPVKAASTATHLTHPLTGRNVPIYVYSTPDYISNAVRTSHSFESAHVKTVMTMARQLKAKLPVTFVDIGCNIGVFSLTALAMDLPVVSLDANIRNLLRLRMSAQAVRQSHRIHLIWNFISRQVSLMYLNFPKDCNIGGATKFGRAVTDTIPAMSTTADALVPTIDTKTVIMKVDIEGGEGEFFRSAANLFKRFTIPAVHMEWLKRHMSDEEREFMIKFFLDRKYTPRSTLDLSKRLDIKNPSFEGDNLVWIRDDFFSDGSFTVPD